MVVVKHPIVSSIDKLECSFVLGRKGMGDGGNQVCWLICVKLKGLRMPREHLSQDKRGQQRAEPWESPRLEMVVKRNWWSWRWMWKRNEERVLRRKEWTGELTKAVGPEGRSPIGGLWLGHWIIDNIVLVEHGVKRGDRTQMTVRWETQGRGWC